MSAAEQVLDKLVLFVYEAIDIILQYYPKLEAFITFRTPYVRDVAIGKSI
jgi:hypothetical protein